MAIKCISTTVNIVGGSGVPGIGFSVSFIDTSTNLSTQDYSDFLLFGTDLVTYTVSEFESAMQSKILAFAVTQGYTGFTANDIAWATNNMLTPTEVANLKTLLSNTRSFSNAPSRSIVTGTGATGFQVSATRDAEVQYSPTMVTTASIAGNASSVLVLEIATTNSATASDWKEIGRLTNAQALSLAITLQSVQTTSGLLTGIVPAGYYAKIRAITSGTVTNTFVSGQEVLL